MERLARRLGVPDAVVIGLGSMLGAGVFVVFAPAASAAGGAGLLLALALAGFIAFCNATSSARLAARYPESGGTYVYGRERLGPYAGFLAGWGFVVGKTASCAAMALTIGAYLWPGQARLVAVAAVVAVTGVNLRGIGKTATATKVLVGVVLAVLALVAVTGVGTVSVDRLGDLDGTGRGVLTAAGLLFFAFAGYARIATLGEEVRDPERTIPRAVPLALGIVLAIYLTLGVVAVGVLGADALASSVAPLADVVTAAGLPGLAWVVRAGATVAVTGVLLSLVAGVGRTTLAMARRRDLPGALAAVHPRYQVPHRAELAVAAVVIVVVLLGDVRGAIGFSSCTVLVYYAITNASALTLEREPGRWLPVRALAVAGLVGCLLLAVNLPLSSVLAGFGVLALGTIWYAARHHLGARRPT
ncbi:APC family permease [Micromonospora sagamiensis]|uniref:Amino acid/polyamine/organocation transporter, APC superfamily (TC 2.A.3) n=1 Tax=Micromonospora sagamiensis TaxID=47875 RepID=A0A562W958_9ACTN|nr:APC family permease [Micromonospora sagamiensis]TWJ26809.1 amino acid/polyamine/organocation transporter, APC superfamily (TC 2.A.3) [Micromonospora sagamiensis]BCL14304.1 amino acid transporter [Micromonospora sagamiensis]